MKTSSAVLFVAGLLFLGEAEGFSRAAKQQLVSGSVASTTTSSRLFLQPIVNPKQELLNNRHSASDWLYNVKSLPQSGVLREIRKPVVAAFVWACIVSVVHKLLLTSNLGTLRTFATKMAIPTSAHSFLVSSLGLLLVFRTNSAYQRFNVSIQICSIHRLCQTKILIIESFLFLTLQEGRKIWEHILSVSRNMTRLITLYSKEVGADRMQRLFKLIAAYPYLLRHHIRPGCLCVENFNKIDPIYRLMLREPSLMAVETRHDGDKQSLGGTTDSQTVWRQRRECWVDRRNLPWSLFPESALQKVAKARNRPLWVCDRIGKEIMGIPYNENFTSRERLTMIGHIDKLTNAVGECERIHQTVSFVYLFHVSRKTFAHFERLHRRSL